MPSFAHTTAPEEAFQTFPGGVNSPANSFRAVGGPPLFFERARGPRLWTVKGESYLDFVQGRGVHLLGHQPASVVRAIARQGSRMGVTGAPSRTELALAREIQHAFPSMERLRFVNSGTEAVMSVVRLVRAATARPLILKFDGGSHGHSDGMLVRAGSGLASAGLPATAGVDPRQVSGTISVPYNDLAVVQAAFEAKPEKIAAVLVEPVAAGMGLIPARPGYLSGLRRLCDQHGALLVFDEVTTGFRLCWGGAQTISGVTPDLTVLGKIVGGGLPLGVFGGRRDLMALLAPEGPVYQAGTFSGHPVVMEAGRAALKKAASRGFYERLDAVAFHWTTGLRRLISPGHQTLNAQGSLFTLFFHGGPVHAFDQALAANQDLYARFFHGLLARGVFFPPSPFDTAYLGAAHTKRDLERALEQVDAVLTDLHC